MKHGNPKGLEVVKAQGKKDPDEKAHVKVDLEEVKAKLEGWKSEEVEVEEATLKGFGIIPSSSRASFLISFLSLHSRKPLLLFIAPLWG